MNQEITAKTNITRDLNEATISLWKFYIYFLIMQPVSYLLLIWKSKFVTNIFQKRDFTYQWKYWLCAHFMS